MKPIQVTRYQTEDGHVFDSSKEADTHERESRFRDVLQQHFGDSDVSIHNVATLAKALANAGYDIKYPA